MSIQNENEFNEDSESTNTNQQENKKLEELAHDISSDNPSASVLREVARLQIDNANLIRKNLKVWSVVIILSISFIAVFSISFLLFPKNRYVNTSDNAAICTINPKDELSISDEDVMDFAKEGVLSSYSYDYVNYRSKINSAANHYFTTDGRKAYFNQLDASNNLERVIKGKLIQRVNTIQSPQVEERSENLDWWIVQVPISIEFFSGGEPKPRTTLTYIASIRVVRIPPSKGKKLPIGIESVILDSTRI